MCRIGKWGNNVIERMMNRQQLGKRFSLVASGEDRLYCSFPLKVQPEYESDALPDSDSNFHRFPRVERSA